MSHDQNHEVVTHDRHNDDISASVINVDTHRPEGKDSRTSLTFDRGDLSTNSNPVHPQIVSSPSVDRSNRTDSANQPPLGSTPTPPDTCHPSGEAPAALPCSVGGSLRRSSC